MLLNNPLFQLMNFDEKNDSPQQLLDKYLEVEQILINSKFDYTYIERIIEFITFMEMAYMYPNTLGQTYYRSQNTTYTCPINATMSEFDSTHTLSVPGLFMNGVNQSRFLIFIVIEENMRSVNVIIKDLDHDGRYYSSLRFSDLYPISQDRPCDILLLRNVMKSVCAATLEVIDVYLGFKDTDKYIKLEKMALNENQLKNENQFED